MMSWRDILQHEYLGNTLRDWGYALAAFAFTFTVLPMIRGFIAARRRRLADVGVPLPVQLATQLVACTSRLFLWVVAVYVGTRFLDLPPRLARIADVVIIFTAWMQGAIWAIEAVKFGLGRQLVKTRMADAGFVGSLEVILFIARVGIFAIATLLALDNLDVNITALVAGLGITGIAIALAVQTVLGDLLASLSIALDKPFRVGDFLVVDNLMGTVEQIGVKSTRLKSLSGEQIILANADVLKARLRNFGRMRERRVAFFLGVTYDTRPEKLRQIPQVVREIVSAHEQARFDRCHLLEWGDSALRFEVVYIVLSENFNLHADILHAINLAILERFAAMGVEFAFPTRTVIAVSPSLPAETKERG
jgi:small-conductance mechanosensitive channel